MTLMPDSSDNLSTANSRASLAGRLLSDPPGVTLKKAREVRKLDLETVADQLNLSAMVVRALEEDDYERLPGPTFVRGYIRCYARLLKLSGDDLVRNYDRMETITEPEREIKVEPASLPAKKIKKGWIVLALIGLVIIASVVVLFSGDEKAEDEPVFNQQVTAPEPVDKVFVEVDATDNAVVAEDVVVDDNTASKETTVDKAAVAEEPVVTPLDESNTGIESLRVESPGIESPDIENSSVTAVANIDAAVDVPEAVVGAVVEAVVETVVETAVETAVEPVAAEPEAIALPEAASEDAISEEADPVSVPSVTTEPALDSSSSLNMTFSGECWVEVWDATGKRIYANLRQKGHVVSLTGQAPIEVKLGNGTVVELEFNGNPVIFASSKRTGVAHVTLGSTSE